MMLNPDTDQTARAGRPFPQRNALVRATPATVRAFFLDRAAWWADVAESYAALAAAGCADATHDAAEALAESHMYLGTAA